MPELHLQPAQALLEGLTRAELHSFARRNRLRLPDGSLKPELVSALTSHLDINELAASLAGFFPKRRRAGLKKPGDEIRLDRVSRLTGAATVMVYSRSNPGLGRVLLAHRDRCLLLRLINVQLFLENRWPVIARSGERVPVSRLYAAFVGRGRIHPEAGAPPPADKPFVLDEGEYGIGKSRIRFEFARSGLLSFRLVFLRYRPSTGRPEYLLQPIA